MSRCPTSIRRSPELASWERRSSNQALGYRREGRVLGYRGIEPLLEKLIDQSRITGGGQLPR